MCILVHMHTFMAYGIWISSLLGVMFVGVHFEIIADIHKEPMLTVVFLDVGQGDAIFVETPVGNRILIDGGAGNTLLGELDTYVALTDRSIDLVIETHPDLDHIGGFAPLIERYSVDAYVRPRIDADTQIFARIQELLDQHKIPIHYGVRGMRIHIDTMYGVYIDILHPRGNTQLNDRNAASLVKQLVYGETSFMLTGDALIENEHEIIMMTDVDYIQSTVLKLGHHGSRTSTSREFLHVVDPEVAIISAGKNNRYGHPHQDVLDNLHFFNIPYRETAREGSIHFESNGQRIYTQLP